MSSLKNFLQKLEKEYISIEIRKNIYKSRKDKKYFSKILFNKRIKIDNISKKLNVTSIFEDEDKYLSIFKLIANFGRMPKLTDISKKDFFMFYSQKTKFILEKEMVSIVEYSPERNLVEIINKDSNIEVISAEKLQKLF